MWSCMWLISIYPVYWNKPHDCIYPCGAYIFNSPLSSKYPHSAAVTFQVGTSYIENKLQLSVKSIVNLKIEYLTYSTIWANHETPIPWNTPVPCSVMLHDMYRKAAQLHNQSFKGTQHLECSKLVQAMCPILQLSMPIN